MLALTMITIWRVISNARLVTIAWAADLVIHPPRKTRLRFVVRLARVFFRGSLGVHVASHTKVHCNACPQRRPGAEGQNQKPPHHPHDLSSIPKCEEWERD